MACVFKDGQAVGGVGLYVSCVYEWVRLRMGGWRVRGKIWIVWMEDEK